MHISWKTISSPFRTVHKFCEVQFSVNNYLSRWRKLNLVSEPSRRGGRSISQYKIHFVSSTSIEREARKALYNPERGIALYISLWKSELCVGNSSFMKIYIITFTTTSLTHNSDFHLLTTSVNAKYYYYSYITIFVSVCKYTYRCKH